MRQERDDESDDRGARPTAGEKAGGDGGAEGRETAEQREEDRDVRALGMFPGALGDADGRDHHEDQRRKPFDTEERRG